MKIGSHLNNLKSPRLDLLRLAFIGMLGLSILYLVLFGIVGFKRYGSFSSDYFILYNAGKDWLSGANPYLNLNAEDVFAYPPNASFFLVPLSLINFSFSKYGMLAINVVSLASIIWMSLKTINERTSKNFHIQSLFITSLIIANPFTTHNFWMGQTTLVLLAFTMAAWEYRQKKSWLVSGIFLGIASFKPQLCVLLFIWFALDRRWKLLMVSALTFFVMSYYPMITQGPVEAILQWPRDGITSYLQADENVMGFQHAVGISSLLASINIKVPSLKLVGVIVTLILWVNRKRFNSDDILAILFGISLTFVGGHDYDYVCLIPLISSLAISTEKDSKLWLWLLPCVFLLFTPQRFIRQLDIEVFNHWRTLVVIVSSLLVTYTSSHYLKTVSKLSKSS